MAKKRKNPSNAKIYYLLGRIDGKMDTLIHIQERITYALITLAGATVGLKLIGSPPVQIVLFYLKAFIFLFTALMAWSKRSILKEWYYIFAFGSLAGIAQVYGAVRGGGQDIVGTTIFLLANIALLMFIWDCDGWCKRKRR